MRYTCVLLTSFLLALLGVFPVVETLSYTRPGPWVVQLVEDCTDGIDNDSDGYIDIFDPDCTCIDTEITSIINNGSFTESDSCCTSIENQEANCIRDWFLVTLSPDYLSEACDSSEMALFDDSGFPRDEAFIDVGIYRNPSGQVASESIGTCLTAPLDVCREYTLTFKTFQFDFGDTPTGMDSFLFTIYGLPTCPDTSSIDVSEGFCGAPWAPDPIELFSFNPVSSEREKWVRFVHPFVPPQRIESLILHPKCGQDAPIDIFPFIYFDDFELIESIKTCDPSEEIEVVGDPCSGDFALRVSEDVGRSYRWYKDSIPTPHGDQAQLVVTDSLGPVSGDYMVHIYTDSNCEVIGPLAIMAPRLDTITVTLCTDEDYMFGDTTVVGPGVYTRTIMNDTMCDRMITLILTYSAVNTVYDTICMGDEYLFVDTFLTQAGTYTRSVGQTQDGCDSVVTLELSLYEGEDLGLEISPGSRLAVGMPVTLYFDSTFVRSLEEYRWKEEGVIIEDDDGKIIRISNVAGEVRYSFEYTLQGGLCMSTLSTTIEWFVPDPEDCTNGVDDDLDGLIDALDSDCVCVGLHAGDINILGDACAEEVELHLDIADSLMIQWVKDDVPIEAATTEQLIIDRATAPGQYTALILSVNGCSSTEEIAIREVFTSDNVDTLCANEVYVWRGEELATTGLYIDTVYSDVLCDSIFSLDLTVLPDARDTTLISIEAGGSYDFFGVPYDASGTYEYIDEMAEGCPTTHVLILEVYEPLEIFIPNVLALNSSIGNDRMCVSTATGDMEILEMEVFDRWGGILYDDGGFLASECSRMWDGSYDGSDVAPGVYIYRISVLSPAGSIEQFVGDITVVY